MTEEDWIGTECVDIVIHELCFAWNDREKWVLVKEFFCSLRCVV